MIARMTKFSRRELITGLSAGALIASGETLAWSQAAVSRADNPDYMFGPGLIYLNTGSLGPTPRSILNAVLNAWNRLEVNPVTQGYGGVVSNEADHVREQLAGLIGCSADELLLTRSTTNAMNIAALGIDFVNGDRILTTDVEHE